jgi:hypothetical protein
MHDRSNYQKAEKSVEKCDGGTDEKSDALAE